MRKRTEIKRFVSYQADDLATYLAEKLKSEPMDKLPELIQDWLELNDYIIDISDRYPDTRY